MILNYSTGSIAFIACCNHRIFNHCYCLHGDANWEPLKFSLKDPISCTLRALTIFFALKPLPLRYQYSFNLRRKNIKQLFVLYGCALFYTVFLTPNRYRGGESARINIVPVVDTIARFYGQGNEHFWPYYINYWGNIFGNIILFIPFGFLCKCLYPTKSLFRICGYGCLLSVGIETMQLALRIGVCDIDDVILNVLGAIAGVGVYRMLRRKKPKLFAGLVS